MSSKQCPDQEELLSFVDADLPPERLERIERHVKACAVCENSVGELRGLIVDVAAPVALARFDVSEHVALVLKRLDTPPPVVRPVAWARWGGTLAVAAAVVVAVATHRTAGDGAAPAESHAEAPVVDWVARGGPGQASLSRDIGLQLYALVPSPRALDSGSRIRSGMGLTAGLRNLGNERAHLLLFGVDAKQVVHWISPEYTVAGTDPVATAIPPSQQQRLLPTTAVFDDLSPGPLRVIAVITREPTQVSQVEKLAAAELNSDGLLKRFPRAEIRQFMLEVSP